MAITALARASTKPFSSYSGCGGGDKENDNPSPVYGASNIIVGGKCQKAKL
jgi:hypothetical protein